jgi:signal transduction histidine kinase
MMTGRRYIKSSSFGMAMLFTILCGAAALSLGYFINYFAQGHFAQSTEAVLESEIRYIEGLEGLSVLPYHAQRIYIPLNEDGVLPDHINPDTFTLREGILVFEYPQGGPRYAAKIHRFQDGKNLLIGYDITDITHDFRFMQIIGIASIVFVMIVVFVSYLISIFVVSGTNKIANTARDIIETGDLSRRVDIGSRWDDLGNMTTVLNMLLSRIEQLMSGVRQVSDNIAHDLRTPLTRLRQKIESAHGERQEELLKEADHLLSIFNALLRISRIETEKQRSRFQKIDLQDVLQDVIDFYEPLAENESIHMAVDLQNAPYEGDRDLLFQAFANILDNALKYTPVSGTISVSLRHTDGCILIDIMDSGPGVPDKDLGKIFERFYRSEESRSTVGTGLGLSLVAAVVELHHGTVHAENLTGGFRIITIL